jgi:hypothetical protein
VQKKGFQVGRGSSQTASYPDGNPALRPILAPGESGTDPIPGYEDFGNE